MVTIHAAAVELLEVSLRPLYSERQKIGSCRKAPQNLPSATKDAGMSRLAGSVANLSRGRSLLYELLTLDPLEFLGSVGMAFEKGFSAYIQGVK